MIKKKKVKNSSIVEELKPIERPLSKEKQLEQDKLNNILDELDKKYGRMFRRLDD